jgi:hypothetical protein
MGHTKSLTLALLVGGTISACAVQDPSSSQDPGAEDGTGSDGAGSGSGDGTGGGNGDPTGPDVEDDSTLPTYPTVHPRIYLGTNKARLQAALTANSVTATRFKAKVDQWLGGASVYDFKAWNGALLGQLSGNPAYCTKAIATVESQVVAAEAVMATGGRPEVALNSYLHIGEMVGDLALVYDWCFDAVTPAQRTRWIAYANQAVSNVWNPTGARWGTTPQPWNGWSVDNPANNYFYSFLRATMLVGLATKGENPQADTFIAKFRDEKILGQLVPTFSTELTGGGSREGTGYGVAMRNLFELYDLWKATTGEKLATKTRHARESMTVFMHQTMPTLDKIAPTGDHARDHTAPFFDYQRHYLQLLISLFPSDPLSRRAKQLIQSSNTPVMSQPFMYVYDFLYDNASVPLFALDGLGTTYYASGIGEIYARSAWNPQATWVNLRAGAYTESHAHQDQGSLMIYKGGWLAYDANVDSRSGLAQDTTAHSLVRISSGGQPVRQIGSTYSKVEALAKGEGWVYASTDLTPAYKGNAAIQKVHREMLYLQPDVVIVFDRVQSAAGTTQTWQLATPTQPSISGNTATISNAGHQLRVTRLAPSTGTMSAFDLRGTADFTGGWRLDESLAGGDHRYLHVMAVDGAVTSTTTAGDPAHPGATVVLGDGRTVTVTFNRDSTGGSMTIDGTTTALTAGIAATINQ